MKAKIKTIKSILTGNPISTVELNTFIVDYMEVCQVKTPTDKELLTIVGMFRQGFFDLGYVALEFAKKLNLTVMRIQDTATGRIIKIEVYE